LFVGVKAAETTISTCNTWAKARKGQEISMHVLSI